MQQPSEVPEGPRGRLQASDALALAGSSVTLGAFTFQPRADGELIAREYVRNGISSAETARQEQAAAGGLDSLHARMPSLKTIVKELGPPTRVVVRDDVGTRSYSISYGRVQFSFTDSLDRLQEIRLQSAEPAWHLAQNIGVGSSLEEVLAALGQPLARSGDSQVDFPGVRFFFENGVVTAMSLVAPQGGSSGSDQEGSDSWGPEDIFTIP